MTHMMKREVHMTLWKSKFVLLCLTMFMPVLPLMSQCRKLTSEDMLGTTFKRATRYPRGWARMGAMGHGECLGYSFGRTIYRGTNEVVTSIASRSFVVTKIYPTENRRFYLQSLKIEYVSLWSTLASKRLARVEIHGCPIRQDDVNGLILEIRKRSDYDFALALVPGPSNLACKGRGEFQRYEAEDKKFSIEVFSEPVSNSLARIRVVVTNKEIMFGDRTNGDHVEVGPKMMMTNDVEVLIGDL